MSSPDIQSLITRSCLINQESGKSSSINPDDLEHPTKLIKFLVGVRYQNEYFPIGGPWSESLDGPNPGNDPQVLIRTAIRCVQGQTGIDLSKCLQWYVDDFLSLISLSFSLTFSLILFFFVEFSFSIWKDALLILIHFCSSTMYLILGAATWRCAIIVRKKFTRAV